MIFSQMRKKKLLPRPSLLQKALSHAQREKNVIEYLHNNVIKYVRMMRKGRIYKQ
jgi:hypothetical protein